MPQVVNVVEVFSSIQGEGRYVGCRQVFVRLAGCNVCCDFCDTANAKSSIATGRIERTAGQRDFFTITNPVSVKELAGYVNQLLLRPHHSISLTGGEPLCQSDALTALVPLLSGRIFLETNGTLPKELQTLLPNIDIISMDIKLPSTTQQPYWSEHHDFLQLAYAATSEVFVKIVVTAQTSNAEFYQAVELIAAVNRDILLVLQPVTPLSGSVGIQPDRMLWLQDWALGMLNDVRVIPQTHKFMGQL
jgi:organic radical activating enzyme